MISIPAACPVVAKRGSEVMPVATCGFAAALCVLMLAYRRKTRLRGIVKAAAMMMMRMVMVVLLHLLGMIALIRLAVRVVALVCLIVDPLRPHLEHHDAAVILNGEGNLRRGNCHQNKQAAQHIHSAEEQQRLSSRGCRTQSRKRLRERLSRLEVKP